MAIISVGNVNRPVGYFKFKTKATTGRSESSVVESPVFTQSTTGNTYYISNSGSVNNIGTSQNSPWPPSKLSVANTSGFTYGDTILLERGGIYPPIDIGGYFPGSPIGKTITYGAYGIGTMPIVTPMKIVPGSNIATNWSQINSTVWKIQLAPGNFLEHTPRIYLDGEETVRARTIAEVNGFKRFNWDKSTQVIHLYSEGNPTSFYDNIKSANFNNSTIKIDGQGNVEIRELDVRGSQGACIDVAYTSGIIEDCIIGKESNRGGIRFNGVDGFKVRNNILDTQINSLNDYYLSTEGGDAIEMSRNGVTNIEIHNNYFYNWVHSAISIEQVNASQVMSNIHFHHNYATAPNLVYGRIFLAYGFSTSNIKIEWNTFENFSIQNQVACPGLILRYNTIDGVFNRTLDESHAHGAAYGLQIGHTIYTPQDMIISSNLFRNCQQSGIEIGTWIGDSPSVKEKIVKNNLLEDNTFENNGVGRINPPWDTNMTPANCDIIMRDSFTVENNTFKLNKFSRLGSDKCIFYGHDPDNNYLKTVLEFNAMNGTKGDVIIGNTINI